MGGEGERFNLNGPRAALVAPDMSQVGDEEGVRGLCEMALEVQAPWADCCLKVRQRGRGKTGAGVQGSIDSDGPGSRASFNNGHLTH